MTYMGLFKKRKLFKRNKKGWKDITYGEMMKIQTILSNKEIVSKDFAIMQVIYGEEIGDISFLTTKIPFTHLKDKYDINGTTYILSADITRLTVSQYIDYQSARQMDEFLSVCLIPEGHTYNDGYSIDKVKEDIQYMKFIDVNAVSVFLKRQFQTLLLLIADYLKSNQMTENIRRMKLPDIEEKLQTLEYLNTEFSTLFYQYAKSLI